MTKKILNNYYETLEEKLRQKNRRNKMKVSGASVKEIANIVRSKLSSNKNK